jgi:hypothetical protein
MANEAGDATLLGNFSKLIELVSANPDYNPANLKFETAGPDCAKDGGTGSHLVNCRPANRTREHNLKGQKNDNQSRTRTRAGTILRLVGIFHCVSSEKSYRNRSYSGRCGEYQKS